MKDLFEESRKNSQAAEVACRVKSSTDFSASHLPLETGIASQR
jgi:hypothetical protein